jgi:uncharacterized damage-inducible protein DinB
MKLLNPDQALHLLSAVELPAVAVERPLTKAVIAAIPADKADYAPNPAGRTAIDLAWHIVAAENRFLEAVINGGFDLTPRPRPEAVRTPADVNAWYDDRLASNLEQLKGLSGERLVVAVDFRGLLTLPALLYLRVGLNHTIHHRGQLSMYLRPMGAKVPSIYGESFDARTDREAREASR